jgi:ADP-heptose:LPS heptosyltransferase
MNYLIIKLGADGDVVRTTTLLRSLKGQITWITATKAKILVEGVMDGLRCFTWEQRDLARDQKYDLVINLEDTLDVGQFIQTVDHKQVFGAHANGDGALHYTDDSKGWFDLSLISRHGRAKADQLKLENRRTYQDLIFSGLGLRFNGEKYFLPPPAKTDLTGDIAITPVAGAVWPMKNWAYYKELQAELEARGYRVNVLQKRATLLEHLGDVQNHRLLIGGDSLPMHFALGLGLRCVSLFTCTAPWEIHDYGIQEQLVSPLLSEYFFKRGFEVRATQAISLQEVLAATLRGLEATKPA